MYVKGGVLKEEPIRDSDKIGSSSDFNSIRFVLFTCWILVSKEKGILET